jgi:hypothetical protein
MKRLVLIVLLALVLVLVLSSVALAAPHQHVFVADFIDKTFLEPVHSVLTGAMFVHNRDVHGIPIVDQMVLLKLESTLGCTSGGLHPSMSWAVAGNNFGCVKWFQTRWTKDMGTVPPGRIWHWSSYWYKWDTPAQGMCGWARFVEHWGSGWFLGRLKAGDWNTVARVYNGGSTYAARCRALDAKYTKIFRDNGYPLTAAGWTP